MGGVRSRFVDSLCAPTWRSVAHQQCKHFHTNLARNKRTYVQPMPSARRPGPTKLSLAQPNRCNAHATTTQSMHLQNIQQAMQLRPSQCDSTAPSVGTGPPRLHPPYPKATHPKYRWRKLHGMLFPATATVTVFSWLGKSCDTPWPRGGAGREVSGGGLPRYASTG